MRFSIPSPQNPVLSWSQVLMFMLNIISFVLTQHYGASEHHLKTGGYVVSAISGGLGLVWGAVFLADLFFDFLLDVEAFWPNFILSNLSSASAALSAFSLSSDPDSRCIVSLTFDILLLINGACNTWLTMISYGKRMSRLTTERRLEETGFVPAAAAVPAPAAAPADPAPVDPVPAVPPPDFGLPSLDNIPPALEDGEEFDTSDLATLMSARFGLGN